jgi:hypothetical protein
MKGTLTVVDPGASTATLSSPAGAHDMAAMTGSSGDTRPLPVDLQHLPQPQVARPITPTEPAYVKYDLTTQKVTAQMADGRRL